MKKVSKNVRNGAVEPDEVTKQKLLTTIESVNPKPVFKLEDQTIPNNAHESQSNKAISKPEQESKVKKGSVKVTIVKYEQETQLNIQNGRPIIENISPVPLSNSEQEIKPQKQFTKTDDVTDIKIPTGDAGKSIHPSASQTDEEGKFKLKPSGIGKVHHVTISKEEDDAKLRTDPAITAQMYLKPQSEDDTKTKLQNNGCADDSADSANVSNDKQPIEGANESTINWNVPSNIPVLERKKVIKSRYMDFMNRATFDKPCEEKITKLKPKIKETKLPKKATTPRVTTSKTMLTHKLAQNSSPFKPSLINQKSAQNPNKKIRTPKPKIPTPKKSMCVNENEIEKIPENPTMESTNFEHPASNTNTTSESIPEPLVDEENTDLVDPTVSIQTIFRDLQAMQMIFLEKLELVRRMSPKLQGCDLKVVTLDMGKDENKQVDEKPAEIPIDERMKGDSNAAVGQMTVATDAVNKQKDEIKETNELGSLKAIKELEKLEQQISNEESTVKFMDEATNTSSSLLEIVGMIQKVFHSDDLIPDESNFSELQVLEKELQKESNLQMELEKKLQIPNALNLKFKSLGDLYKMLPNVSSTDIGQATREVVLESDIHAYQKNIEELHKKLDATEDELKIAKQKKQENVAQIMKLGEHFDMAKNIVQMLRDEQIRKIAELNKDMHIIKSEVQALNMECIHLKDTSAKAILHNQRQEKIQVDSNKHEKTTKGENKHLESDILKYKQFLGEKQIQIEMLHNDISKLTERYSQKEKLYRAELNERGKTINMLRNNEAMLRMRLADISGQLEERDLNIDNLNKELSEHDEQFRFLFSKLRIKQTCISCHERTIQLLRQSNENNKAMQCKLLNWIQHMEEETGQLKASIKFYQHRYENALK